MNKVKVLAIALAFVSLLDVFLVGVNLIQYAEIKKLRDAFSAVVSRERGSCQMDPGTRVVCGLSSDGRDLSRLELADDDQIVSGKSMRAPIGKKKGRKVPR